MDLDSPSTWARVIVERVALFKRVMPMAMENLSITQHRNTLQYAHTQGGSYKPKVKQFDVGDFVYFQWQLNDTLDTSSSHNILRIKGLGLQMCWSYKELTDAQFGITSKIVCPVTCRT
jgi:hypothetical protein